MDRRLADLPPPPGSKTGWPWTTESNPYQEIYPLPKISIITPSYNQGHFIEETIRSILLQGYPNLEFLIVDGGSQDQTVDIIHAYEHHINYWISEPDRGQAHAINKGWQLATGDIITWLNSDDIYLPNFLLNVAKFSQKHPHVDIIYADSLYCNEQTNSFTSGLKVPIIDLATLIRGSVVPQASTLITRRVIDTVGLLDESLRCGFDYQYWLNCLAQGFRFGYLETDGALYRLHDNSKTCSEQSKFFKDWDSSLTQLWQELKINKYSSLPKVDEFKHLFAEAYLGYAITCATQNISQSEAKRYYKQALQYLTFPPSTKLIRLLLAATKVIFGKQKI